MLRRGVTGTFDSPSMRFVGIQFRALAACAFVALCVALGLTAPAQAQTPTISFLSPGVSELAGGITTTITGTNFTGATALSFGGTPAISFTVNSATSITATVPAHAAGEAQVAVTAPGGTGTGNNVFYYFVRPVISSISPNRGPATGGTTVVLTGSGFTGPEGNVSSVSFGIASASTFTVDSDTQITVVSPPSGTGEGPRSVGVLKPAAPFSNQGSAFNSFIYGDAPTITAVTPSSGPSGASITITGTGFTNAVSVAFDGNIQVTPPQMVIVNDTTITLTAPFHAAGTVSLAVVATTGTATSSFTYVPPPPTFSGISPNTGSAAGGTSVTITGTNLSGITAVTFGGTAAASITQGNATFFTATTPAHAAGPVDVVITTAGGSATGTSAFTYTSAAPTISSLSPTSGPTGGGYSVAINGTNLAAATSVTFDGATAVFSVASNTQLIATAPAHAAGAVTVEVVTPSGTTASVNGFTYVAAPVVSSATPNSGPTTGGTVVDIDGTNFSGVTQVSFGGLVVAFTQISATRVRVTTPAHAAGAVDVIVTTAGGTGTGTNIFTYAAPPAPTVTSVAPTIGNTSGGTSVVITGTNFTGATAVTFGGTSASFTVVNATTINATTPAHAAGVVNAVVTTPSGSGTGNNLFTYAVPEPSVTTVSPNSGPTTGGTSITINGSNFTGATAVTFGGTAAASFTVLSANQITATTPAHAAGLVNVVVTTPSGTGTASNAFTFVTGAPTVTSVAPNSGSTVGGTSVTVTGTNLTGATAVTFGGTAAASFSVVNATTITAVTPAHAAGAVNIVVTTPGGSGTGSNLYTYAVPAPTVTAVAPNSGSTAGGTSVTISGTNLTGATAVTFGGTAAASFSVVNATTITATTPAHAAGAVNIVVTTPGGSGTGSNLYNYTAPAPTVTAVAPNSGSTAGGTSVTITGTNLTGATAVTFGGTAAASFAVVNATTITATTSAHAAGAVNIVVTTPGGSGTGSNLYTYAVPAPTVTAISPSSGSAAGGTSVTITGTNFTGATIVTLGGTATASFTVVNATTITATTSAHAVGTVDLVVTTPGGSATRTNFFTYVSATAPTVSAVTPGQGPSTGGTMVTITGINLTGTTTVTFGSTAASSFAVLNSNTIQATTPAHAIGPVDVSVTTPAGSATAIGAYSYTVPADSQRLRSAQIAITPLVAQTSGQMMTASIDEAIADGFGGANSGFFTPSGSGMRLNFAAEPRSRVDDAFAALAAADPKTKALPPPRKEWLPWMQVSGSSWRTDVQTGDIRGGQVNILAGLTHRLGDDVLLGAFAGYENFDYTSNTLSARLKGDGWTAGGYFSWRFVQGMRADLGLAYSRLGYDGTAGTAHGTFAGERWLASFALVGTYDIKSFTLEPSARIFTLLEREDAYVDSLGTPQDARRFSSGRASGGMKATYAWIARKDFKLSPFAGLYGDFYFSHDDATFLASTPAVVLSGWSARVTAGVTAGWAGGTQLSLGSEVGGLGSSQFLNWRGRASLSMPF